MVALEGGLGPCKEIGSIPGVGSPMAQAAPETNLQNDGRLCIGSLPFVRLYRNNTGTLTDSRGVPVSYGLAIGSADTIGLVAPYGRFLSIEWKRPGWTGPSGERERKRHESQLNWQAQINGMRGVAGFAQSLHDGLRLVYLATLLPTQYVDESVAAGWANARETEFRERTTERDQRKKR